MKLAYAVSRGEGTLLAYGVLDDETDSIYDLVPECNDEDVTIITGPAEADPETGQ